LLLQTSAGNPSNSCRRLSDFYLVDAKGTTMPVETLGHSTSDEENDSPPAKGKKVKGPSRPTLSGVVYPAGTGALAKDAGRRVADLGALKEWDIAFSKDGPTLVLKTERAAYTCVLPSHKYRAVFLSLMEQAAVANEVVLALNPDLGGKLSASIDDVKSTIARKGLNKNFGTVQETLQLNANFIVAQLDKEADRAEMVFRKCEVYQTLKKLANGLGYRVMDGSGGVRIAENGKREQPQSEQEMQDLAMAMRLEAKERNQASRRNQTKDVTGDQYLHVDWSEIAHDYPSPNEYQGTDEMDEFLTIDEEALIDCDIAYFPKRLMKNFHIYDAERITASLEMAPMRAGVDRDTPLFISGDFQNMDDTMGMEIPLQLCKWDASFGHCFQSSETPAGKTPAAPSGGSGGSSSGNSAPGGSGSGSGSGSGGFGSDSVGSMAVDEPPQDDESFGVRTFTTPIREWTSQVDGNRVFILVRTDFGWYCLGEPAPAYKAFFEPVLKCARVGAQIIAKMQGQRRASRLSLADIVKALAAEEKGALTYISKHIPSVEKFLTVHGQIFLRMCEESAKEIHDSGFAKNLREHMLSCRHHKIFVVKEKQRKGGAPRAANPMKDRLSGARKPMEATATRLVQGLFKGYYDTRFKYDKTTGKTAEEIDREEAEREQDDELVDNDKDAAVEDALVEAEAPKAPLPTVKTSGKRKVELKSQHKTDGLPEGVKAIFAACTIDGRTIRCGDVLVGPCTTDDGDHVERFGVARCFYKDKNAPVAQIRGLVHGSETVLGDTAGEFEVFLTEEVLTIDLTKAELITDTVYVDKRGAKAQDRLTSYFEGLKMEAANNKRKASQEDPHFTYRSLYIPQKGMFCDLPKDLSACVWDEAPDHDPAEATVTGSGAAAAVVAGGTEIKLGEYGFVECGLFDAEALAEDTRERPSYLKKGAKGELTGVDAWAIVRVDSTTKAGKVRVTRLLRPEEIDRELRHTVSTREVFMSDMTEEIDASSFIRKCWVGPACTDVTHEDVFFCTRKYTGVKKGKPAFEVTTLPKVDLRELPEECRLPEELPVHRKLHTMDIFAGCGGLTEGMHQAGACITDWAIEYEKPAADAFKKNFPDAHVFNENCNAVLYKAMVKAGLVEDCHAPEENREAASKFTDQQIEALPLPGQVNFICGGPPCQGYSGMNRFNKGNWSMIQSSMIISFLSFCDFYRPEYFLLENVRAFVAHNKTRTFRMTVRALLEMGYQVRFGVLNAGNFGVAQSRKRTFIWASLPGESLPDWPRVSHAFKSPQLVINLPNDVQYCAVPVEAQGGGAPLRSVTVKDTIGDLPAILNGADKEVMAYTNDPDTDFQREIRNGASKLVDHISKEMNEVNLNRCVNIPKGVPGADWRHLYAYVNAAKNDEEKEKRNQFKGKTMSGTLVPWCLPNTMDKHNGWRGLFGRLDWEGHFPTSVTDPQPMGKVGQVFHPVQDRIVSVRECARSQGFPDTFMLSGTVHNKHRQVGNAVPVPLARALGRMLNKARQEK